jgi:hypothetical protein
MILRVLAQESPDSELRLERCGRKKFWGLNLDFERFKGLLWKISGALVNWILNLEHGEGSMCKIEGQWTDLQLEFKFQGPSCKVCKGIGLQVSNGRVERPK